MVTDVLSAPAAACGNCGTALHGAYCHACGQKAAVRLRFAEVLREAADDLFDLDGRIVVTAKTLLRKPGQLTLDFLHGRRARYVSPLRIYLATSLLFFFLALLPFSRDAITVTYTTNPGESAPSQEQIRLISDRLRTEFFTWLARVVFLLMPVFAALTWAFRRKRHPYFVEHLYYSIHLHAFAFFVLSLNLLARLAGAVLSGALFVWLAAYVVLAGRRFFERESRLRAFATAAAIFVTYAALFMLSLLGLMWLAVARART